MKILLTENRMEELIKNQIMKRVPNVVNVLFKDSKVFLASDKKTITRTDVIVIADPRNVLGGETYEYNGYLLNQIKDEVISILNDTFGLDIYAYGSEWGLSIKVVTLISYIGG